MGDLVHARPPWLQRVALADGEQNQRRLGGLLIAGKDRAPLASRPGDVELHAAAETGSVTAFLFAAEKPLVRRAGTAQLGHRRLDRRQCCRSAAGEILGQLLRDDPNLEAQARACAHICLVV